MNRIGIFGSSFNPIHIGHMIIADQAIERFNLDKILFVPTKTPYHKKSDILDFDFRTQMAYIEAQKHGKIEVSNVEQNIEGNSYTFDVIRLLEKEYRDTKFYFIMGSDSLVNFDTWYKYDKLLDMIEFIVFKRPGDEDLSDLIEEYRQVGMSIHYYDDLQLEISSTFIRESIKAGKSVRYLLSDEIIRYIESNRFYE